MVLSAILRHWKFFECFVFAYYDLVPISYYSRIKQEVDPNGPGSPVCLHNQRWHGYLIKLYGTLTAKEFTNQKKLQGAGMNNYI